MQDRYVGDIGDFANYGLLRYLCGVTGPKTGRPFRLGVVWYLNKPSKKELKKSQGDRIGYLNFSYHNDSTYRICDPCLYDKLQKLVGDSLVSKKPRTICDIESRKILPDSTLYFSDPLNNTCRDAWSRRARTKIANADLVFLNPDIGIASPDKANSRAHVTMDEIEKFADEYKAKSLIIYQHFSHFQGTREKQIDHLLDRLEQKLKLTFRPWALLWNREPIRFYFIVPRTNHHKLLLNFKILALLNSPWKTKGNFSVSEF